MRPMPRLACLPWGARASSAVFASVDFSNRTKRALKFKLVVRRAAPRPRSKAGPPQPPPQPAKTTTPGPDPRVPRRRGEELPRLGARGADGGAGGRGRGRDPGQEGADTVAHPAGEGAPRVYPPSTAPRLAVRSGGRPVFAIGTQSAALLPANQTAPPAAAPGRPTRPTPPNGARPQSAKVAIKISDRSRMDPVSHEREVRGVILTAFPPAAAGLAA